MAAPGTSDKRDRYSPVESRHAGEKGDAKRLGQISYGAGSGGEVTEDNDKPGCNEDGAHISSVPYSKPLSYQIELEHMEPKTEGPQEERGHVHTVRDKRDNGQ